MLICLNVLQKSWTWPKTLRKSLRASKILKSSTSFPLARKIREKRKIDSISEGQADLKNDFLIV